MDKTKYIETLKDMNLRPNKIKIKPKKEVILNEQESKDEDKLFIEIIKWFQENPYPDDSKVHSFANKLGIDEHKFEGYIYKILSNILVEGRSKDFKGTYDPKELKMGIKVELEHTTIPIIAEKIARDHIAEIPDYYTRLDKMESEAGVTHHESKQPEKD